MKPGRTRQILKEYGYRPRRGRGQNFLIKESVLDRIAELAVVGSDETVIEIGPGTGGLTRRLAKSARRVVAIEIEHELAMIVKAEVKADNLEVVEADVLDVDLAGLASGDGKMKVVANLPFNITTPVLFKLLATPKLFSELLLLVQKEVALRIAAAPGKKPYGILSAQAQLLADCEIAMTVGPEAFSPRPKVESALVRLTMLESPRAEVADVEVYRRVVRAAFARRRKTLKNSFASAEFGFDHDRVLAALEKAGIDHKRRAETLTVEEFARLSNLLSKDD